MIFSNQLTSILLCLISFASLGQITSGKITFERKTNLLKKYPGRYMGKFIKEGDKRKIDVFHLYFNDSLSVFVPADDEVTGRRSWMTTRNKVIQNIKSGTRMSVFNVWGQEAFIIDSLVDREWKITDNHRKIGQHLCTQAVYHMNDSTRIYAWYSEEVIPSIGPETYRGLPGAILGLATEDGGVVYFAKKVEELEPDFKKITPKKGRKTYSEKDFRKKLEEEFVNRGYGQSMVEEVFKW